MAGILGNWSPRQEPLGLFLLSLQSFGMSLSFGMAVASWGLIKRSDKGMVHVV